MSYNLLSVEVLERRQSKSLGISQVHHLLMDRKEDLSSPLDMVMMHYMLVMEGQSAILLRLV
jgi:hypothetical protein